MAKGYRSGWNNFRTRTRVIVKRIRARAPRRNKTKTLLIIGGALLVAFLFKDKLKGLIAKP